MGCDVCALGAAVRPARRSRLGMRPARATRALGALLSLLALGRVAAGPPVPLTLLSPSAAPNARCMDGSAAGYYLAPNASSTSWLIELEGGGECASKTNCDGRRGTHLFSSNYWKKVHRLSNQRGRSQRAPRARRRRSGA